jgi:hypothetical protein
LFELGVFALEVQFWAFAPSKKEKKKRSSQFKESTIKK